MTWTMSQQEENPRHLVWQTIFPPKPTIMLPCPWTLLPYDSIPLTEEGVLFHPLPQSERAVAAVEVTLCDFRLCHKSVMHFHLVFLGHSLLLCSHRAAREATHKATSQVSQLTAPAVHPPISQHSPPDMWLRKMSRCMVWPQVRAALARRPRQLSEQCENAKMAFALRCSGLGWFVIMTINEQKCLLYKTPCSNRLA